MDVGELISFKPELVVKPSYEKKSGDYGSSGNPRKRSRLDSRNSFSQNYSDRKRMSVGRVESSVSARSLNEPSEIDAESLRLIQEKVDQLAETTEDQGPLDEARLKRILLNFDKKVTKNQELRIKFPDDPKKFMDSELELHESVEELHVVATVPEQYSLLVEMGIVKTLLALLSHENTDISVGVIYLLQEMTDAEDVEDSDGAEDLIESLIDAQIIATLVHNLDRLDESVKSEAEGVHHTLGIVENLAEMRPEICNEADSGGLLAWLLKRLKSKMPFDPNKLYASEILAICLQTNVENQKLLGTIGGTDVLLQQLAQYKRHDPTSSEEQEMMENLFDTLCSALLLPSNREPFLLGEGLQLMNLMLRERKLSRNGALRVLNYALCNEEGSDNCNKFVDILGLRTIFPLFMKTPKKHGPKGLSKEQHEEHIISVISWLLRNCRSNQRQRLISKFSENDHEKVDRLLELHFKYLEKVIATNKILEEQASAEDLDEDLMYLRRLDGGLFTLQLVDYIMLDICATGPPSIKRRVLKILNVRNASIKTIKNVMREYASNIGDEDTTEKQSEIQDRVLDMLDKFQNM